MSDLEAETEPPYTIEFYEDDNGHEPALAFMQKLSPTKARAIGVALNEILAHLGPDVVKSDFGKVLGDGLYEFRLKLNAEQVLRRAGKDAKPEPDDEKILIRVFFHPYGDKIVLLLSGYDKAAHDSKPYQNSEIEDARRLLKHWKERERIRAKSAARTNG